MSSTNRGGQRRPQDYYRTPRWAVEALLNELWGVTGPVLDPGCGDGAILETLRDHGHTDLIGVEVDPARATLAAPFCDRLVVGDFLSLDLAGLKVGTVIGNPPYCDAEAFVRHALYLTAPGGSVHMLLRLAFLAGQRRARGGLWESLDAVRVLSRRPKFLERGTDSADYAWISWRKDRRPGAAHLWILPPAPLDTCHENP
jgi:hypothetical protein